MDKVYETISSHKVLATDTRALFDLLKYHSAPHLQVSVYLKHEKEYVNVQNRTSIFGNSLRTVPVDALNSDILMDSEGVHCKTMSDSVVPVKTLINGTKFESGGHMVRVINSSAVSGDIDSILVAMGCRLSNEVCQFGFRIQLLNGVDVTVFKQIPAAGDPAVELKQYDIEIIALSSERGVQVSSDKINSVITSLNTVLISSK